MHTSQTADQKKRLKTPDLAYISIGAALIAICSWIYIPAVIQFTLQTFAVFAVLLILGGKRGTLSVIVYVILGAFGVPVFSGFTGGIGILLGKTGGYILGFLFMGLIYILFVKIFGDKPLSRIAALVTGLFICYAFGTAWFMLLYLKNTGPVGLMTVLSWCVFPFIVPDLAKMALAFFLSGRVRRFIR